MTQELLILGAGGLAREVAQLAASIEVESRPAWRVVGFIGSSTDEVGRDLGPAKILGDDEWLVQSVDSASVAIAIGDPEVRARVARRLKNLPGRFGFPNLVHPTALVDLAAVTLGVGNIIAAGCLFTCDIEVGDFNYFNLAVTVGHDSRIGSFNVLNPTVNVSGGVTIGDHVLVGTGAQILEGRVVATGARVGAGAVVTRDVAANITVVGIPARQLGVPG